MEQLKSELTLALGETISRLELISLAQAPNKI